MKTQKYLSEHGADYEVLAHRATYSAQEMADAVHISGDHVAKTVVIKVDGESILAVLQATHVIDFDKVRMAMAASEARLADEQELEQLFPDCELGAAPPFGSQYGMRTLVDAPLAQGEFIVFEGNTHYEAIRLPYVEYDRLEQPMTAEFTRHV